LLSCYSVDLITPYHRSASKLGIEIVAMYSLSLSLLALSKAELTTSGATSTLRVRMSSFCVQRRTFVREVRLVLSSACRVGLED
jgi:hypothetical protein